MRYHNLNDTKSETKNESEALFTKSNTVEVAEMHLAVKI